MSYALATSDQACRSICEPCVPVTIFLFLHNANEANIMTVNWGREVDWVKPNAVWQLCACASSLHVTLARSSFGFAGSVCRAKWHCDALLIDLHTEVYSAQPRRHVQLQCEPLAAGVRCVAVDIADAASKCGRCGNSRSGRRQRHHRQYSLCNSSLAGKPVPLTVEGLVLAGLSAFGVHLNETDVN